MRKRNTEYIRRLEKETRGHTKEQTKMGKIYWKLQASEDVLSVSCLWQIYQTVSGPGWCFTRQFYWLLLPVCRQSRLLLRLQRVNKSYLSNINSEDVIFTVKLRSELKCGLWWWCSWTFKLDDNSKCLNFSVCSVLFGKVLIQTWKISLLL
jgi:hypothetical protein